MDGRIFVIVIAAAALLMIEASKFIYNHYKLEDEVLDLRRRLGR